LDDKALLLIDNDGVLVRSKQSAHARTHTHTHLNRNYTSGHIYQDFMVTAHYYIAFYHFNSS